MELFNYNGQYYEFCDAFENDYKCLSKAMFYFTNWHSQFSFSETDSLVMEIFDRKPLETLASISHVFFTIATIICWFVLARIIVYLLNRYAQVKALGSYFLIEFLIIALPCILSVNILNSFAEVIVLVMCCILSLIVWRSKRFELLAFTKFDFGARPHIFTLLRSTVYIWTVLCILAIDFKSFPKEFRKSRSYGASLMDVGIGLFITVMAMVSKRLSSLRSGKNVFIATAALLVLGTLRTIIVMFLNYGQDDHEYGRHLNAFFILGFTKFFGTVLSTLVKNDMQLLPLSVGVIAFHELTLQCGLQEFVISPFIGRDTFLQANREGLSSIPGFVGLYLLCLFIYKNLNLKGSLTYIEFTTTLKTLFGIVMTFIFLTIVSTFTIGISRVTCNFGYIVWISAITLVMTLLYLLTFDIILNIWLPLSLSDSAVGDSTEDLVKPNEAKEIKVIPIPVFADAVNMNGLVYFMIGNFLTGFVNIFLDPDSRSDLESIGILTLYLLVTTCFVFLLYLFKIRIA